ncbi:MAG: LysR family transcriptional regulator [Kofleriaceae bacterium]
MTDLVDIDLNLLVSLDAILTTRSVTTAATKLGLSKPAMSHALNRIRRLLGDEVLVRSGKEWVLTERARSLEEPLDELLASITRLVVPQRTFSPEKLDREFRIHTTDLVLSMLGVAIGHALAEAAPSASLRFMPVLPDEIAALRGDVDLGIGVFANLPHDLRKQRLFDDKFCCVVRRDHPSVETTISLKHYASLHHVLVAPRGRPGSAADEALGKLHHHRRVTRTMPFFLAALHCVSETDCIATISLRLARTHAERFGLRIVEPPLDLPKFVVEQIWHPRLETDLAHAWLRKLIARVAHGLPKL